MDECRSDLGMYSGVIPDSALTASSSYDVKSVGPQNSRIRKEKNGGAWCPKSQITRELQDWLQIDLQEIKVISLVETQGRFGNGQGQEFAPNYVLEYQRQDNGRWMRYKDKKGIELIKGNSNTYVPELRELRPPVIAKSVRLMPWSSHPRTACLRVELYGCPWSDGVVSYSMRQGDRRSPDIELFDFTYDGENIDGYLSGGLGQLTDFEEGGMNFRLDHYSVGKRGYEWVGWKNESNSTRPLEIVFEFDSVRNLTGVRLHVSNFIAKEVSIFHRLTMHFSVDGFSFGGNALVLDYARELTVENVRNIFVSIPHRSALLVKLAFFFNFRWLLISEVRFFSVNLSSEEKDEIVKSENRRQDLNDGSTEYLVPISVQLRSVVDFAKLNMLHQNLSSRSSNSETAQSTRLSVSASARVWKNFEEANVVVVGAVAGVILIVAVFLFLVVVHRRRHVCSRGSASSLKSALFSHRKSLPLQLEPLTSSSSKTASGLLYRSVAMSEVIETERQISNPGCLAKIDDNNYELHDTSLLQASDYEILPTFPLHAQNQTDSSSSKTSVLPFHKAIIPDKIQNENVLMSVKSWKNDFAVFEILWQNLIFIEKLGEGLYGEVHLCRLICDNVSAEEQLNGKRTENVVPSLVAVKMLRKNASEQNWVDFQKEMKILSNLKDPNILEVFGCCTETETPGIVLEYMIYGDLFQFLRDRVLEDSVSDASGKRCLSYGSLIYMATQIASGMKYLESLNFIHRDLAARNCLVGQKYQIKIADFGMSRSIYSNDYCDLDEGKLLPIRWMAWESILLGRFSCKADVWSFGVTLWEILGLARETPFASLNNDEVVNNCEHIRLNDGLQQFLTQPVICPKEIYDLMMQCWNRDEGQRPTFREIHMFLQHRNIGYTPVEISNLHMI